MPNWKVTYWDGGLKVVLIDDCDAWNVVNITSGRGIPSWSILLIERVASPA